MTPGLKRLSASRLEIDFSSDFRNALINHHTELLCGSFIEIDDSKRPLNKVTIR
jgi:hypothetical protein